MKRSCFVWYDRVPDTGFFAVKYLLTGDYLPTTFLITDAADKAEMHVRDTSALVRSLGHDVRQCDPNKKGV